jgi:hypothetical protein
LRRVDDKHDRRRDDAQTAAASTEADGTTMTLDNETTALREIGGLPDAPLTSAAVVQNGTIAGARAPRHRAARIWRAERTSPAGLIKALATLRRRLVALEARNHELEASVRQLRTVVERNLHDGVQNELVALLVKLTRTQEDRETPAALAARLASVGARQRSSQCARSRSRSLRCCSPGPGCWMHCARM